MFVKVFTLFAAVTIIIQVNGEVNEWLIKATDAQNSIKDSIAKVKVSGENKDKIKSVTDKAFDDFVKFVKNGVKPTYEKLSKTSGSNPRIVPKLNNWIKSLESLNNATKNSTVQDSLNKFESTINQMVENAPNFAEKVKSVKTPEYQGIVLEFGEFIKNVIDELAYKMKGVETQLKPQNKPRLQS